MKGEKKMPTAPTRNIGCSCQAPLDPDSVEEKLNEMSIAEKARIIVMNSSTNLNRLEAIANFLRCRPEGSDECKYDPQCFDDELNMAMTTVERTSRIICMIEGYLGI